MIIRNLIKILILVLGWCIFSGTGFAETHHFHDHVHSQHPIGKTGSPFETSKGSISLHCLLKGHSIDKPCPHILSPLKNTLIDETTYLSTECGRGSGQKIGDSGSSGKSFCAVSKFQWVNRSVEAMTSFKIVFLETFFPPDAPPPRII